MNPILRLFGVFVIFCGTALAWAILGGITDSRTTEQQHASWDSVGELWGRAQVQPAPELAFAWDTVSWHTFTEVVNGRSTEVTEQRVETHVEAVQVRSTTLTVDLSLDQRRKGLVWYPLYDVDVQGAWTYRHERPEPGTLTLSFTFPDQQGIYDGFVFAVDGVDHARELRPQDGVVRYSLPVQPGQEVHLAAGYRSRGMETWTYRPSAGVANLENFQVVMTTDFANIDFPPLTMSPTDKARAGEGWRLGWDFAQVVTGHGVGMVAPTPIQPGELAAGLAFSAPVSLFFFFLVIFVLSALRRIDIHPINYALVAGAFFAFHLLFAYTADHLPVEAAFALSSVVSVALVVSYLRLVVGPRFALVEAGLAQGLYLVGFSLAHFWDGFTGLTVTVLSVVTLFGLMQLTGRVRWSEVLSPAQVPPQES